MLQKIVDTIAETGYPVRKESDSPSVRVDFRGLDDFFLPLYEVLVRATLHSNIDEMTEKIWNTLRDANFSGMTLEEVDTGVPIGSTVEMDFATILITGSTQWRTR